MQRRLWLAMLIAVLVGLIVGTVITSNGGLTCEEWQDEYVRVAEEGRGGVLAFINEGPTADRLRELEKERPSDCPTPDV